MQKQKKCTFVLGKWSQLKGDYEPRGIALICFHSDLYILSNRKTPTSSSGSGPPYPASVTIVSSGDIAEVAIPKGIPTGVGQSIAEPPSQQKHLVAKEVESILRRESIRQWLCAFGVSLHWRLTSPKTRCSTLIERVHLESDSVALTEGYFQIRFKEGS